MELAKTLKRDPRECVNAFFARLATADAEYKAAFDDEIDGLIDRVKGRAKERLREAEEEARQQRLGPGGLDPYEVLETLPEKIRKVLVDHINLCYWVIQMFYTFSPSPFLLTTVIVVTSKITDTFLHIFAFVVTV